MFDKNDYVTQEMLAASPFFINEEDALQSFRDFGGIPQYDMADIESRIGEEIEKEIEKEIEYSGFRVPAVR